jgi:hypothetical protein
MVKRIATCLLSFAVILTMTLQAIPHAPAMTSDASMSMMADMDMSDCGAPCKGMTPACIDAMGCLAAIGLPATPFSAATPFERSALRYAAFDVVLSSRTIRPELFPPILRA